MTAMLSTCLLVGAVLTPHASPGWASHPVNTWVKQSPRPDAPVPAFGWEGSGDYDPVGRRWIHFGGHDGIPQGFALFTYDLESGRWRQHFPGTSPPGCCCVDGANVFDVANRRFVRFPGAALGHGYQWSRGVKLKGSPVWLYDLDAGTWTNMRPAPYAPFLAREGLGSLNANAAYDANRGLAMSFGGQASAGETNNLFAYDAYANALHRLPTRERPSPRDGSGLCYDAKNDQIVMFGSQYDSDERTWTYRYADGTWVGHDLTPRPVGKKLGTYSTIPRMAYDSRNGVCLCVTWDTNTNEHQTWAFDSATRTWTRLNPLTEPEPSMSRSRNLGYSAEHNVFILETSSKEGRGKAPQVWTYRFANAPADSGLAAPSNVSVVTDPGGAVLTWTGVPAAREYRIERAMSPDPIAARYEAVATVAGMTFRDANLTSGGTYFYTVRTVGRDGIVSRPSASARTQPRVLLTPVVSVLAADRVEVAWKAHLATDVIGYNVYRGNVVVRSVKKGTPAAWKDNDPEYSEPVPVEVRDITGLRKLNDRPLTGTSVTDTAVNLARAAVDPAEYRFNVFAYIVRAVNRLGTESGPSPYALTIPSEPTHVLNRESGGTANLKWSANPEKGIAGYRVYKLEGTWTIVRLIESPVRETTFTHAGGRNSTRYWVVAVDALGQEGQPSSPVWHNQSYKGFFEGEWHQ